MQQSFFFFFFFFFSPSKRWHRLEVWKCKKQQRNGIEASITSVAPAFFTLQNTHMQTHILGAEKQQEKLKPKKHNNQLSAKTNTTKSTFTPKVIPSNRQTDRHYVCGYTSFSIYVCMCVCRNIV